MNNIIVSCIDSRVEPDGCLYGRFFLGPFYSGKGVTIGNGLRRWLLTQVAGVGITAVMIEGIEHEFCSIKGVAESVLDILFNLRGVVLSGELLGSRSTFGYFQAQGPGVVYAGDIRLPAGLRVANPASKIATLSSDGFLSMKVVITEAAQSFPLTKPSSTPQSTPLLSTPFSQSKVPPLSSHPSPINKEGDTQNEKQGEDKRVEKAVWEGGSFLSIENLFLPVVRANYLLENDNEEEYPQSRERLLLEIWTNGSLHPRQALSNALVDWTNLLLELQQGDLLMMEGGYRLPFSFHTIYSSAQYLQERGGYPYWRSKQGATQQERNQQTISATNRLQMGESQLLVKEKKLKNSKWKEEEKEWSDLDICNLELSVKTYVALKRAKINSLFDLTTHSTSELLSFDMIDSSAIREIQANIWTLGFQLEKDK